MSGTRETPDQARTRRRWVTLAEAVAVAGVVIGGLTLWMNWSEGREAAAERRAERTAQASAGGRFDLRARVTGGDQVTLEDPRHELIDVAIAFPGAIGIAGKNPATARIEAAWFRQQVLKATDGGADEREGRLPVLVTARYRSGEALRTGAAIVEVIWRTDGRLIGGRSLSIESARVRRLGGTQGEIDALWAKEASAQRSSA